MSAKLGGDSERNEATRTNWMKPTLNSLSQSLINDDSTNQRGEGGGGQLTPITRRMDCENTFENLDASQIENQQHFENSSQNEANNNSLISCSAAVTTMVFKNNSGYQFLDQIVGVPAGSQYTGGGGGSRQLQESTLILEDDLLTTNSIVQNNQLVDCSMEDSSQILKDMSQISYSEQNSTSLINITNLQQKSPSKELLSKAKHDERRSNLRKKRANDQVMKVVEQFIKDQTSMATIQAFIEANFINDMLNVQVEIMHKVLENEMRKVIRSVLSEIYFAHISTLFVENIICSELREIGHECMNDSQLVVSTSDMMGMNESLQFIDYQESTINLQEVQFEFYKHKNAMQIWTEALPATKIFNEELELKVITEHLYDSFISSQITYHTKNQLSLHNTMNVIVEKTKRHIVKSLFQSFVMDIVLEQIMLSKISNQLINKTVDHLLFSESLANELVTAFVDTETTALFKGQVELEYFARSLLEEIICEETLRNVEIHYDEFAVCEDISEQLIENQVLNVVQEQIQNQLEIQMILTSDKIVEKSVKDASMDVLLDMILEDFLNVYSGKMLEQAISEVFIMDSIFDDLLKGVISKESKFQVNLEKDSQMMLQAFLNNQVIEIPKVDEPIITVKCISQRGEKKRQRQQQQHIHISIQDLEIPKELKLPQLDPLFDEYLNSLVEGSVRSFIRNIITSLILPHQIYKRVMTRSIRKTTYAAIQQAVDIAYRLEEDTINVADKLLDDFVESQIREMVQEYPNKNNYQRRSHTILIDTSETKLAHKSSQGGNASQFCITSPQTNERTRNGLQSNIIPPQTGLKQAANTVTSYQSMMNQTNIFMSEDNKSDHSHITAVRGEEPLIASQITRQINYQSQNKRYNRGIFENNMSEEEMTMNDTFSQNGFEEIKGRQVASQMVAGPHHGRNIAKVDMSFQQQQNDHQSSNIPGPHNNNNYLKQDLNLREAYKSNGTLVSGVNQGNHRNSSEINYCQNGVDLLLTSQSQEEWIINNNNGPQSTKNTNVVFRSKKGSKESIDSSQLETRIVPPTDINFRSLNMQTKVNPQGLFDQKKRSKKSSVVPVIPINFQGHFQNRASDMTSPEELIMSEDDSKPISISIPKTNNQGGTFRHLENTMSSITQRSGTALEITNQQNTLQDESNSLFVYRPQINQFDPLSNTSIQVSTKNKNSNAVPFVQLNLVDNISNKMKSPQHARYFVPESGNNNNENEIPHYEHYKQMLHTPGISKASGITKKQNGRTTSSGKRALIDLRSAMAQIQTASKQTHSGTPLSNGLMYPQVFTQPKQLPDSRDYNKLQYRSNTSSFKQQNSSPIVQMPKPGLSPQESIIKVQLQKIIMVLKQRVQECKSKASQKGIGPSTSLLMTQLACDVLHSLAEQILNVSQNQAYNDLNLRELGIVGIENELKNSTSLSENSKCRQQLFSIDKKIKELVQKLTQNQSLMNKQDYQLCLLQANQLAMLNCQKLTCIMQPQGGAAKSNPAYNTYDFQSADHHLGAGRQSPQLYETAPAETLQPMKHQTRFAYISLQDNKTRSSSSQNMGGNSRTKIQN